MYFEQNCAEIYALYPTITREILFILSRFVKIINMKQRR